MFVLNGAKIVNISLNYGLCDGKLKSFNGKCLQIVSIEWPGVHI